MEVADREELGSEEGTCDQRATAVHWVKFRGFEAKFSETVDASTREGKLVLQIQEALVKKNYNNSVGILYFIFFLVFLYFLLPPTPISKSKNYWWLFAIINTTFICTQLLSGIAESCSRKSCCSCSALARDTSYDIPILIEVADNYYLGSYSKRPKDVYDLFAYYPNTRPSESMLLLQKSKFIIVTFIFVFFFYSKMVFNSY